MNDATSDAATSVPERARSHQKQRRLVLCFDGTWNTALSHTNVSQLYSLVADTSMQCAHQRKFYDEGVGSGGFERFRGGFLGAGLDQNVREGYAWLANEYSQTGTKEIDAEGFVDAAALFFLGFSRGAFTARSLVGLINYLGIPKSLDPT